MNVARTSCIFPLRWNRMIALCFSSIAAGSVGVRRMSCLHHQSKDLIDEIRLVEVVVGDELVEHEE
jgi:hypothetical protein